METAHMTDVYHSLTSVRLSMGCDQRRDGLHTPKCY